MFVWKYTLELHNSITNITYKQVITRNQKHHLEGNAIPAVCYAKCYVPRVELTGFLRQKSYKIQGFSRPFHSIIQGQFNALLPVDHFIAYSPTDTQEKKTHCFEALTQYLLVKRSEQFFYQLYSNYVSSHSHQILLKLSR